MIFRSSCSTLSVRRNANGIEVGCSKRITDSIIVLSASDKMKIIFQVSSVNDVIGESTLSEKNTVKMNVAILPTYAHHIHRPTVCVL